MEEWKKYKATDYCLNVTDGTHDSPKRVEQGKYLITSKHIKGNQIDFSEAYKISLDDYNQIIKRSKVDQWDVIISMIGAYCGFCYIEISPNTDYTIKNVGLFKVGSELKSRWLYYYLSSPLGKQQLALLRTGSSQPYIALNSLRKLMIPVPEGSIMRRIVNILHSLDDKIEVNRRINDNLEQQAQALFKSWFVDFEPFRDQPFVESELGMIPEGWRVENIYEYIDVIYGAPYKSTLFNDNKGGLPLIRIRDLKTNAPQFYTPEVLPNTEYINAGDIVAGMDAEFIPYVWLGERGVLNQRCCKFKGKNDAISNYYILFLIKPELEYVQSYKTGTTVSHLGKSDIDRFRFVTPPLEVIKSFSNTVDCMLKEVVNRSKESRRLAELRDTLLPRLMSGELKVNEIENAI